MIHYRPAIEADISALADIRLKDWGSHAYWVTRIEGYMSGMKNPQGAKQSRIIYLAEHKGNVVGFIAGHLTTRYDCEGELQWINVLEAYQGKEIASELLNLLADWFLEQGARMICVDVDPDNEKAGLFMQSIMQQS